MFYAQLICICLCLFSTFVQAAEPCQLSLVYKDNGKTGYMAAAPSNEGLYKTLYQEVASSLGCTLFIERYPKKRTHMLLKAGEVDLYPSTGFDRKRSEYLYYIPNGLFRHEFYLGLTPNSVKNLTSISELNQHGLTWIFEGGSTIGQTAEAYQVLNQAITNLTDDRAITMLSKGRHIFYRIIREDYSKYLKNYGLKDLKSLNISTHKTCCKTKSHKLYTGIARNSDKYVEEINPDYNKNSDISARNFPYRLSKDTLMYQVAKQIQQLIMSGRVDQLYQEYIVVPGHTP